MLRLVLASLLALASLAPFVGKCPRRNRGYLGKGRPMKWVTGIVLLLAVGALTVTIVVAQDKVPDKPIGTRLKAAALTKLFGHGETAEYRNANGVTGTMTRQPDGTVQMTYKLTDGTQGSDSGTWRIHEDRLCQTYKNFREGKEGCFDHFQVGPNLFHSWSMNGQFTLSYSLRK